MKPEKTCSQQGVFMYCLKMLIDGQLVDAVTGDVATIHNPVNQEPVAEVPEGRREDARLALSVAEGSVLLYV